MADEQKIIAGVLPIACGLAGHIYLARMDSSGKVLAEINGLATSANGDMKPIGYLPSDRLKVYESAKARYYHCTHIQATLYAGTAENVDAYWRRAQQAARQLNDLNLPYPFLGCGPNSNSVAFTLAAQMGFEKPKLSYRLTPYRNFNLLEACKNNLEKG